MSEVFDFLEETRGRITSMKDLYELKLSIEKLTMDFSDPQDVYRRFPYRGS